MKTIYKTLFLAGLIFLNACTHQPTAAELLKNDNMRHEIMKTICNDTVMATEMVNYITSSGASSIMKKGSCDFIRTIMASDMMKNDTAMQNMIISNVMFLVNRDSVMCDKTCTQITQNPQIVRMMERNMNAKRQ